MEIIVCILITFFFAALEIWNLRIRSSKMARLKHRDKEFVVLPHRHAGNRPNALMG